MLESVLYMSFPRTLPWPNLILEIDRAVEAHHGRLGLTGVLVFRAAWIVQYLEGEAQSLADRYSRIAHDPRHRVVWAQHRQIARRALPGLSMGYIDAIREPHLFGLAAMGEIGGWTDDAADWLTDAIIDAAVAKYPKAAP